MPGERRAPRRATRPSAVSAVDGSSVVERRVGERRLEEVVERRRRRSGSGRRRRSIASTASAPIATFIGSARSAMWCSGPGKPTSVSSTSPVAGLVGLGAWWRWPCSSSRASAHGLAAEGAEDHPERVDRGQERADVAERRRAIQCQPPALADRASRISSLEKKPENGGTPDSARPPMTKQPKVNGIALRKPPIWSRFCSPRHRAR